jgi:ribosomal protein S18 acetylase RimI-like enzyme
MPIRVRDARPDDLDLLVRFNEAMALETEGLSLDPGRLRAGVARALSDPQRGRYLVAELDGSVAGALLLTREWSDWRDGWFWWIQSVYVVREGRRHGVYRALHAEVLRQAQAAGDVVGVRLYVEHDNAAAQRTYQRLGMQRARYLVYEQAPARPGR